MRVVSESPFRPGFAIVPALGWLLALATTLLAASQWLGGHEESVAPWEREESSEQRTLKLALSTTTAQNAALRAELDRLLVATSRLEPDEAADGGPDEAAPAAPEPSDAERAELSSRIAAAVARAARMGDAEANKAAAMSLMEAFRKGKAGFPALQDAYLAADDPKAREIMLPTLLFIGQEDARDFLIEQLAEESDPGLRRTLLQQSVRYASPEQVGKLQDTYLETLRSSEDPELRNWAIRGLRYGKGKDVQKALLSALEDPDEEIRIAAIANLASRPQMHGKIRDLQSRESGLVGRIAECSLLVNGAR